MAMDIPIFNAGISDCDLAQRHVPLGLVHTFKWRWDRNWKYIFKYWIFLLAMLVFWVGTSIFVPHCPPAPPTKKKTCLLLWSGSPSDIRHVVGDLGGKGSAGVVAERLGLGPPSPSLVVSMKLWGSYKGPITPVIHLFLAIHRGYITPFINGSGAHLVAECLASGTILWVIGLWVRFWGQPHHIVHPPSGLRRKGPFSGVICNFFFSINYDCAKGNYR